MNMPAQWAEKAVYHSQPCAHGKGNGKVAYSI